ncbi:MAG: hypothetical protein AB1781_00450 [Pseudomonadota bacterium]
MGGASAGRRIKQRVTALAESWRKRLRSVGVIRHFGKRPAAISENEFGGI